MDGRMVQSLQRFLNKRHHGVPFLGVKATHSMAFTKQLNQTEFLLTLNLLDDYLQGRRRLGSW